MLLMGKSTISTAMFNSYVSLPEGILYCQLVAGFNPSEKCKTQLG